MKIAVAHSHGPGCSRSDIASRSVLVLCLFLIGSSLHAGPALAQVRDVDVAASLECFVKAQTVRPGEYPSRCERGGVAVEHIVASPSTYGHATVQAVLDALVELALSTHDRSLARQPRQVLYVAGILRDNDTPRNPGVIDRMERLFFSGIPHLRLLPLARNVADRARVSEFLRRVATEPNPPDAADHFPASDRAISQLGGLGEEGVAVVRELLVQGTISTPQARARARRIVDATSPRD